MCVASSGIAACLHTGGRTAHSRFKIPTAQINSTSLCNISAQSSLAELLRRTDLIVWDEAVMSHKHNFEALHRTLCDIMGNNEPFGGKVCLLGGDFRQILPVVKNGNRASLVQACIKRSFLWRHFQTFNLFMNMRLNGDIHDNITNEFRDVQIQIGEGTYPVIGEDNGLVALPNHVMLPDQSLAGLINKMYDDPFNIVSSTILTVRNKDVQAINQQVAQKVGGALTEYLSIDSVDNDNDIDPTNFPVEFLNSLLPPSLPPHQLQLRIGFPVILLRNLNPSEGLCNGTRMIIRGLHPHVLDCEVSIGRHRGKRVFIPRIDCCAPESEMPFKLRRRQFPISVCFAMTINKAQGQSMDKLGVYLPVPVFSHGQLYVALSRATDPRNIFVVIDHEAQRGTTKNIVYKEVL